MTVARLELQFAHSLSRTGYDMRRSFERKRSYPEGSGAKACRRFAGYSNACHEWHPSSIRNSPNFNRSYTYDGTDHLLTMSAPGDSCSGLSWTYDAWGNRTDQSRALSPIPFHALTG